METIDLIRLVAGFLGLIVAPLAVGLKLQGILRDLESGANVHRRESGVEAERGSTATNGVRYLRYAKAYGLGLAVCLPLFFFSRYYFAMH